MKNHRVWVIVNPVGKSVAWFKKNAYTRKTALICFKNRNNGLCDKELDEICDLGFKCELGLVTPFEGYDE